MIRLTPDEAIWKFVATFEENILCFSLEGKTLKKREVFI